MSSVFAGVIRLQVLLGKLLFGYNCPIADSTNFEKVKSLSFQVPDGKISDS